MIFLPHTNTVILLEPYCGTITEPGLPVVLSGVVNTHTGAMIDSCMCQVPVPCPHCAHELPMGLRGRGKVS